MPRDYRALAALAIRLRRIWHGFKVITPKMVVDTMKALYAFFTGKAALWLLAALFTTPLNADTVSYSLIGRPRSGVSSYSLGRPVVSEKSTRGKNSRSGIKRRPVAERPNKLIVVSATWCVPCRKMYPIVEQLKADGYDAEVVYDYDGPANITAYPTILFMRGDKIIYTNVGVTSDRVIRYNLVKPDATP